MAQTTGQTFPPGQVPWPPHPPHPRVAAELFSHTRPRPQSHPHAASLCGCFRWRRPPRPCRWSGLLTWQASACSGFLRGSWRPFASRVPPFAACWGGLSTAFRAAVAVPSAPFIRAFAPTRGLLSSRRLLSCLGRLSFIVTVFLFDA